MQGPISGSSSSSPSCLVIAGIEASQHFVRAVTSVLIEEEDVAAKMSNKEAAPRISDDLPPRRRLGR